MSTASTKTSNGNWPAPRGQAILRFIEMKEALEDQLERRTVFLFYSESELAEELCTLLRDAGIAIADAARLTSYEAGSAAASSP